MQSTPGAMAAMLLLMTGFPKSTTEAFVVMEASSATTALNVAMSSGSSSSSSSSNSTQDHSLLEQPNGRINRELAEQLYKWEHKPTVSSDSFSTRQGLRLVQELVNEFASDQNSDEKDVDDLVQDGIIALMQAKLEYNAGFEAFARTYIRDALSKGQSGVSAGTPPPTTTRTGAPTGSSSSSSSNNNNNNKSAENDNSDDDNNLLSQPTSIETPISSMPRQPLSVEPMIVEMPQVGYMLEEQSSEFYRRPDSNIGKYR
mmetsp:Transcript_26913/g.75656  ORF Transcript_26913/g.75656 Transcript_26913/m.75656 type:complete len:258 (+) Transcript_26913:125-898(+)